MNADLSREDVYRVADRLVEELLTAAGIDRPPVDAVHVARRHLGLTVRLDRRQPAVKLDPADERHQWAAAHAVGTHLKSDLLHRLGFDPALPRPLMAESPANLLAVRLLAPTHWFAGDARAGGFDLAQLKRRYATAGWELLAERLLDLDEPCVITVTEGAAVVRRRSNAWRVGRQLQPAERECRDLVRERGEPQLVRGGGWTVQGWPSRSGGSEREILRAVCDDEPPVPGVD